MKNFLRYSLGVLVFLTVHNAWAYTPEDCVRCHKKGSGESTRQISWDEYALSVHAKEITCLDCHGGVIDENHITTKGSGKVDCGECHEQENRHGLRSQVESRPECYSCHTRHAIMQKDHEASSVHPDNLKQTCRSCHPEQSGEAGWLSWLSSVQIRSHGKQDFGFEYDEENCLGCHQGQGAHGEKMPLNHEECYKCHILQNGQTPLLGTIHPTGESKNRPSSPIVLVVYAIAIILLLGGYRFYVRRASKKTRKLRK